MKLTATLKSLLSRPAMTPDRAVIVGLGNPGAKYRATRHNVGFQVIDRLLSGMEVQRSWNKFHAEVFQCRQDAGKSLLLVKPTTFMNLSGRAVSAVVSYYDLPLDDLMVVCDDFHLPLGKLRFRRNGSHGGQKGLADIISQLGTNEFPRLRIGIAAPDSDAAIDHVLGTFKSDERPVIDDAVATACDALRLWLDEDLETVMNRYNSGG